MLKRGVDLLLVILSLPLVVPVLLLTALAVRLFIGSPVLFRQPRPGLGGRVFTLRKFRSMTDERDASGALLPDAERLTRFGRFLRASSLDELPSLLNILRGEMSLVGPRPLLVDYLPLYTPEQSRRHDVRPGLTGWAQVKGRNDLGWDDRLALDIWYVDHRSLRLDIKILFMTVGRVLGRKGVRAPGSATMTRFEGPGS